MLEELAEQTRTQKITQIMYENDQIFQYLAGLENHLQSTKSISGIGESTNSLLAVLKNAEQQAIMQRLSKKKELLLIAEYLEEAHRFGVYSEPITTICRFLCLIYPGIRPNTIRKALPAKYKDPYQSKLHSSKPMG